MRHLGHGTSDLARHAAQHVEHPPVVPGCHLYYPSRRQVPPALAALIEALRLEPAPERTFRTRKRAR